MGDNDVSLFLLFVISFIFSGCTKEKFFPWYFSSCSDFKERVSLLLKQPLSQRSPRKTPVQPNPWEGQRPGTTAPGSRDSPWEQTGLELHHPRVGKGVLLPGCLSLGRAPLVLTTPLSFQVRKHNCLHFWSEELSLRKESGVSLVL